jgi:hypothetical protein
MRILHLDAGKTLRGGQHQVLHLLRALDARGFLPQLLAPAGSPLAEHARLLGFDVAPLSWRAIRSNAPNFDLLHCHDARSHSLAALWSETPFVVSRRVAFPIKTGPISRWKYSRPARFLAISRAVEAELLKANVPPSRISLVPDCTPLPETLSSLDGPIVAIDSGDPQKGAPLLRQANLDIRFSSNLLADLLHARLFLYITESEGLGSAVLLAMAHGVPVVASNIGGLPEIVRHEETGLLVENQPAAIAAAAARLLNDPALAARLASNARRLVEERFTIEQVVDATLAAYRSVLA